MKKTWTVILIVLFALACARAVRPRNLYQGTFETAQGEKFAMRLLKRNHANVFYFISPECPLCVNYAKDIREIRETFGNDSIRFIGVISGKDYTAQEVLDYLGKYGLDLTVIMDPTFRLVQYFKATITPEVFVVDNRSNVLYTGKIDNWAVSLGQHRQVVTEFYLRDALTDISAGVPVRLGETEPVGCFIEWP